MTNCYIFDLDDTLAKPDYDIDSNNLYMTINHHTPIPEMMAIFMDVIEQGDTAIILTNRHPDLSDEIADAYGCPVVCRRYCLSIHEMELVESNAEEKQKFMQEMPRWKTKYINELSHKYDHIIFYDDMAHMYDTNDFLDNIEIRLPIHLL